MAKEGERMIKAGDFVGIRTNGQDFLGDQSMFNGMAGEVIKVSGTFKPVYTVRITIEDLFSDRELFFVEGSNADSYKPASYKPAKKTSTQDDVIEHPAHYTQGIECMDYIESHKLNYARGNIIKYVTRAGLKDASKEVEDLEKARWYLDREIERVKKANRDG